MNNCGTCKHWHKPSDRSDFHGVVRFEGDRYMRNDQGLHGYERGDKDDLLFGLCCIIDLGESLPLTEPTPLAVTQDGSGYRANLYTQAEFGCMMWEKPDDD